MNHRRRVPQLLAAIVCGLVLAACSGGSGGSGATPGGSTGATSSAPAQSPAAGTATTPAPPATTAGSAAGAAAAGRKVLLVLEENRSYDDIIGSSDAPYINDLATRYGSATKYDAGYPASCPSLAA